MTDHYKTLGVERNSSPDEIKKAYRKMAAQHHPDKGGDTATFQKVQAAYDTLSDPQKKQQYDNPNPFGGNPQGGPGGFHFDFGGGGFPGGFQFHQQGFDINDLFGHMFRQQAPRQQLYRTQFGISLEEAYNGGDKILQVQTPTGNKVITVIVPKGINSGDQIRYDNILDGGSLIVDYRVQPHLRFERKGNDLYCNQQLSVLDLITGSKFQFVTISGKTFEVDVKPNTQPYMQLKIQGQGMPIQGTDKFGDQIILIKPFIPDKIDTSIINAINNSRNT